MTADFEFGVGIRCGICGQPCIPLADYDAPTCVRCDAAMEAVVTRAAMPQCHVDAIRVRPAQMRIRRGTPDSYYGPADPEVLKDLDAALFPSPLKHRGLGRRHTSLGATR